MESYIEIDKNMIVNTTIGNVEVQWHDVKSAPFMLHGLCESEKSDYFHRLPDEIAAATSNGVRSLSRESAGIRVRFSTDSSYIAIRAKYLAVGRSSHLTMISTAGFDLYVDGEFGSRFLKEFRMPFDMVDSYEQIIMLGQDNMRSYTINFPVHAVVQSLEIGLKPGSLIDRPKPYRDIEPVTFYGSSIVHGTAATRPGNTYPAIISRDLNIDFRNIGFSGQAKGEPVLADYLAKLPTSIFVCDYDHNAPTADYLAQTHYKFYETVRKVNSKVPYIMITRPDYWTNPKDFENLSMCRDVIMTSYLKARASGDKNVYFIDGLSFQTGPNQYEMTVDSIHPNDAGFIRMANIIETFIKHILEKN